MMKRRYDLVAGLRYLFSESAPSITLKGEADLADRVAAIAARYGIPVVEDGALTEAMHHVPLDAEIPEELYRAVAAVLNQIERAIGASPVEKHHSGRKG